MCGIAGWISPQSHTNESVVAQMTHILGHRGPDDTGLFISPNRQVVLGHRRLSIIDLSGGASQPMTDPVTGTTLVFNGEIYNHAEIRRSLERLGCGFRTDHSDTEALLRAYLYWGLPETLSRLIGMFSFAIYDANRRKVLLARDRVGIKPLYYSRIGTDVIFASEAKALFSHPALSARLNKTSLYHSLTFRSLPAPLTLFDGVEKLGPAQSVEIDLANGVFSRQTYWNPLQQRQESASYEDACDQLEHLLSESISYRMESDVPVGVFLSGGLDSGYLLNRARAYRSEIHTFTVRYHEDQEYDESEYARRLATELSTTHHEVSIGNDSFDIYLPEVAYCQDEPIAAPVCLPVYLLAKAAREANVPVILAGEGSDELFIGYDTWLRMRTLQRWDNRLPDLPNRLLRKIAAAIAVGGSSPFARSPDLLLRSARKQPLFWGGAMDFAERGKNSVLGRAMATYATDTYSFIIKPLWESFVEHRDEDDITAWMSFIDLRFRLPELMLPRLDKMGMAHSIEGRVPFLDHRLIEFFLALPPRLRSHTGSIGKQLFKSVAARRLPASLVYRKKQGFRAPVAQWKSTSFGKKYLPALLSFAARTELFSEHGLKRLFARTNDRLYFSLTNFMLWYLIFIENVLPETFPDLPRYTSPGQRGADNGTTVTSFVA